LNTCEMSKERILLGAYLPEVSCRTFTYICISVGYDVLWISTYMNLLCVQLVISAVAFCK
jgi:hypothetical protein